MRQPRLLRSLLLALFLVCQFCLASLAQAAQPSGIVLVAFGTSVDSAKSSLMDMEAAYAKAFPDTPLLWAYTSDKIRAKLAREGHKVFSVREALDECARSGLVDVRVQSLHITPGEEFSQLQRLLVRYVTLHPTRFDHVWLGHPLLESSRDLEEVLCAVMGTLPAARTARDAVVLMGHGNNRGPGDLTLACVATAFNTSDPRVFLATVEGGNGFAELVHEIEAQKPDKVYLQPFMLVAGDHAQNDLAGEDEESWASQLKACGLKVEARLTGLGSLPGIQNIFVRHTAETTDDLVHPAKIF